MRTGIAGERQHAGGPMEPERQSDMGRTLVLCAQRLDSAAAHLRAVAWRKLPDLERERQVLCGGIGVTRRPERAQPIARAGRPGHGKRILAPRAIHRVHEEERPARDVVAVQVGEMHRPQLLRVATEFPQRKQRGGA